MVNFYLFFLIVYFSSPFADNQLKNLIPKFREPCLYLLCQTVASTLLFMVSYPLKYFKMVLSIIMQCLMLQYFAPYPSVASVTMVEFIFHHVCTCMTAPHNPN